MISTFNRSTIGFHISGRIDDKHQYNLIFNVGEKNYAMVWNIEKDPNKQKPKLRKVKLLNFPSDLTLEKIYAIFFSSKIKIDCRPFGGTLKVFNHSLSISKKKLIIENNANANSVYPPSIYLHIDGESQAKPFVLDIDPRDFEKNKAQIYDAASKQYIPIESNADGLKNLNNKRLNIALLSFNEKIDVEIRQDDQVSCLTLSPKIKDQGK